jgi:hypothetical protein
MSNRDDIINQKKIKQARDSIRMGMYEAPEIIAKVIDLVVADLRPSVLRRELASCPVGNGSEYRDLTARVWIKALDGAVDVPFVRREFPVAGGRGDIDLPFRFAAMQGQSKVAEWGRRFEMRSILVEVKNEQHPGGVEHVRQIADDVASSPLGRIGFLVCRNGLTTDAQKRLNDVNRNRNMLVLAFNHGELASLVDLDKGQIDEYLHRKELVTLRRAG